MGYGYEIPANQLGGPKILWVFTGMGYNRFDCNPQVTSHHGHHSGYHRSHDCFQWETSVKGKAYNHVHKQPNIVRSVSLRLSIFCSISNRRTAALQQCV